MALLRKTKTSRIAPSFLHAVRILLAASVCASPATAISQGLQIGFGAKGVQTLSFAGVVLEDVGANGGDAFHIWHMKATDLQGNRLDCPQCGWGENNNGTTWNAATLTETYTFGWGQIATQFFQSGNNLDMVVTETNNAGSGLIFDGAEIYPLALHFPRDPAGFSGYTQFLMTTRGPGVSVADFGAGVVTEVVPDESAPLYVGWKNVGGAVYSPLMSATAPDGLPNFLPGNDRPVPPGTSFSYTVSLRFTPEGTPAAVADAYTSFAAVYPSQMTWTDRRILGTAYLASSPANATGDATQPGGFPTNPRRYFNDPRVDVTTPGGLAAFQGRILAQAVSNAVNTQAMGGQGVITWDIEGEQYPQQTSYVCSPEQIATVAPEMESVITDQASAYVGQKLDDAYFKTMTSAGLKVGLCLRPQAFTLGANGTANQVYLSGNAAIITNLENKARFANSRWGVTIFYVDSTVDTTGGTLDPAIFQQLITDLPSFLFIPEESTPRYYAYSGPFYSFIFHNDLGTPASILNVYPKAFGANLVNDVAAGTLAKYQGELTQAVAGGDILMGHADYWQANDPTLVAIYQAAGKAATPPPKVTPPVRWQVPRPISYGTPLGGTELNASADVPGAFTYAPAAGSILPAGNATLLATFNPADPLDYGAATASVNLQVSQATPMLTWPRPAPIAAGTALGGSQLNATADVAGSFAYNPAAGTVLPAGTQSLTVAFAPADAADYLPATGSTSLVVSVPPPSAAPPAQVPSPLPAPPVNNLSTLSILSPSPGDLVSGAIVVAGQCKLPLDPAGSYLMVDGAEYGTHRVTGGPYLYPLDTTILSNGVHTLQLWAHDIGNNVTLSTSVAVVVTN